MNLITPAVPAKPGPALLSRLIADVKLYHSATKLPAPVYRDAGSCGFAGAVGSEGIGGSREIDFPDCSHHSGESSYFVRVGEGYFLRPVGEGRGAMGTPNAKVPPRIAPGRCSQGTTVLGPSSSSRPARASARTILVTEMEGRDWRSSEA